MPATGQPAAAPEAPSLQAVLFDMDGTLTDSEKLWSISLDRTAADLGGTLSAAAREAMVGHDMVDSIRMFLADIAPGRTDLDPAAVAQLLTRHTAELFAEAMPWRPGAQQLLTAVRAAGLRTALVTATHRSLVELALGTLGRNSFDAIVAGDEVQSNKPDPEPYLRAMQLLGVTPAQAIAVEDSPNGSRSAAAAAVPVLVVPSETAVPPAPGLYFADSLVGIDPAQLRQIHHTHLTAPRA